MPKSTPNKDENMISDVTTPSEKSSEQSTNSGNTLDTNITSNSVPLSVPITASSTTDLGDDYDSMLNAFLIEDTKPEETNLQSQPTFSNMLMPQNTNTTVRTTQIEAPASKPQQNFTSGGFQAPNPNLRVPITQNRPGNISSFNPLGNAHPGIAPNRPQATLGGLPFSSLPNQAQFNQRPQMVRAAHQNLRPPLTTTGFPTGLVANTSGFGSGINTLEDMLKTTPKERLDGLMSLFDRLNKKEITNEAFQVQSKTVLGPYYPIFLRVMANSANKSSGPNNGANNSNSNGAANRNHSVNTNPNQNANITPGSNVYNYPNIPMPGNQPLNRIWDNSGRQGFNQSNPQRSIPLQAAAASQRVQNPVRPAARTPSKKASQKSTNSPRPIATTQPSNSGAQQSTIAAQPTASRANVPLIAPQGLAPKPQPVNITSSAPAHSNNDYDTLTDVMGYVGVDLKEESENIFNGALGQSAYLHGYSNQSSINGLNSSQAVPNSLAFLDQKALLTKLKLIAKKTAGLDVDPLVCELITLAVEERVRDIVEFTVKSSKHRFKANQPLPPPPLNHLGKPMYTIKVSSDPKKQLQALERYDKAEQRQFEDELENGPQQDDDNDPKSKRSKNRRDGLYNAALNPKNMSDEARKRMADQTSVQMIGGPIKSWMISSSSSAPRNPSPLGSTPPVHASNLNGRKTSNLNPHQPSISSNLVPKDQARNRTELDSVQAKPTTSNQPSLAQLRANSTSVPTTPSSIGRSLRNSTAGTIVTLNDVVFALENDVATNPNSYATNVLKRAYSRRR